MIDVESLWLQLLEEGESDRLEAKEAQGGIGDSIMQSICAFANEPGLGGGYLLLGVRESDQDEAGFVPIGVNDIDTLLNTLQTNCRDQFTASVAIQAESGRIDGNMLVAIRVEEADDATKPIRFKGIPGGKNKNKRKTGAWRRGINGDYECHESELEPLIRAKNGRSYDQTILPGAEWDDIDPDMIALYRQRRADI
ncbi:MAG: helix-turn-helix domain-containing protein, partial [Stutzerimonas sp.]|uniref:AlbA family DNA-binding domain-containing protein n=1 Tax=Stutzerimonas sp. TaxID=2901166 RepID=UPI003D0DC6DF